jgi:hypothetical protein
MLPETLNSTRPGPFPVEPLLMLIHGVPVAAVHGQPLAVFTLIALVAPDTGAL